MNSKGTNTRPIPEKLWKENFAKKDGGFSGKKFEELSLDLLEQLFSKGWKKTKESHDGNKDFVLNFSSESHWAESKAYKEPLSYHIVSPTLFMAFLGDATKIIFLSRSHFRKTAKPLFSEYQRRTGKQILCFDGVLLDNLILRSKTITEKYFPGHIFVPHALDELRVDTNITADVSRPQSQEDDFDGKLLGSNEKLVTLTVGIGELVRIDVVVVNENIANSTKIAVTFEDVGGSPIDSFLDLISFGDVKGDRSTVLTLEAGEVRRFSVLLRATRPGKDLALPKLVFSAHKFVVERALGRITVSRLYRIEMLGKSHKHIRDTIHQSATNIRTHRIFHVIGRSGVGKSRLLKEIGNALLVEGYDVHRHNKEFDRPEASDLVLRGLLADLNQLPLVGTGTEMFHELGLETECYDQNDIHLLTRLIYEESGELRKKPFLMAKALRRSFLGRKTALIIDNVQNVDDSFAAALDELVSLLALDNTAPPAVVILAFNEDLLIHGSVAETLSNRLCAQTRCDDSEQRIRSFSLSDFDSEDIKAFVESAMHARSSENFRLDDYPLSRDAFYEHIPRTPLHLWETLRYLRDKDVLRLENDLLVIEDDRDSTLAALLRTIPPDVVSIMQERWREVRAATDRGEIGFKSELLVDAMRTAYALGQSNRNQIIDIGVAPIVLDQLVKVGLLREADFGNIEFFHQRTFAFFQQEFEKDFPRIHASKLVDGFQKLGLIGSHFQQFFILNDRAGKTSIALIKETARRYCRRGASREYYGPFLSALVRHLLRDEQPLEDWMFETFQKICDTYQQLESLLSGCEVLDGIYRAKVLPVPPDGLPGRALADFLYRLANAFLSVAKDESALEVVNQAIAELPLAKYDSARDCALAQAKLLYRKLSVVKNFGRDEEALSLGASALNLARQYDDRWLEIETLMDRAEILINQDAPQSRQDGLRQYAKAIDLFAGDFTLADPVPVRSFVAKTLLQLVSCNWSGAIQTSSEGIRFAESIRNHFWAVRLHLLKTASMLCAAAVGKNPVDLIVHEIRATQDIMNTYSASRDAWANHYLMGKLQLLDGKPTQAADAFAAAVRAIAKRAPTTERLIRRAPALTDIAMTCRVANICAAHTIFEPVRTTSLGIESLAILQADNAIFNQQWDHWKSKAFLCVPISSGGYMTLVKI